MCRQFAVHGLTLCVLLTLLTSSTHVHRKAYLFQVAPQAFSRESPVHYGFQQATVPFRGVKGASYLSAFTGQKVAAKAKKRAIIVAIGDYPEESGWQDINSQNDIAPIKASLMHHGFAESDIVVLKDQQATRENIQRAFRNHLIKKSRKGDIAVFHFSGHGQQIYDDNGDEQDGYDEALAPYDSKPVSSTEYKGHNHLRDDAFGEMLEELRKALGVNGNVFVSLDACYSGTATRDMMSRSRGYPNVFGGDGQASRRGQLRSTGMEQDYGSSGLAPMAVISGSRQDQANYEVVNEKGKSMGSLSWALSRQLAMAGQISYQELYERIREDMASKVPKQVPQLEGDSDVLLFSGKVSPNITKSIIVTDVENANTVKINAGLLAGIREGADVSFYDFPDDPAVAKPITKGRVTASNVVFATIRLQDKMREEDIIGKKVVLENLGTGQLVTRVAIQMFKEKAFGEQMKNRLERSRAIELVTPDSAVMPELIITDSTFGAAQEPFRKLSRANNKLSASVRLFEYATAADLLSSTRDMAYSLSNISDPKQLEERIMERIMDIHASKLFQQLESNVSIRGNDSESAVTLSVVPVEYALKNGKPIIKQELSLPKNEEGRLAYLEQVFVFRLKNNTDRKLYYNILQMGADRTTSVLVPSAKFSSADRILQPNEALLIDEPEYFFKFTEPLGPQQFKVIVATEEFYLGDDLEKAREINSRSVSRLLDQFSFTAVDGLLLQLVEQE